MTNQNILSKTKEKYPEEQELEKLILDEKTKGTSDIEIGNKYGVNLRFIERVITKAKGVNISAIKASKKIKSLHPKNFQEEKTTIWSFKSRGNWATHSGEYRGNWSPYIPRNVILKYSKPGETVLDYFCGAGTTAVEAKLLGRKCIAYDINKHAIELAEKNVGFDMKSPQLKLIDDKIDFPMYEPNLSVGDARDLLSLGKDSIDLICAHPPYANIIQYTDSKESDLSFFDIDDFLAEMEKVAKESFRVLKPGRQCAILIGDTRRKKHIIPLGFKLIDVYLNAGFKLRELVIKRQHNCKTTGFWYANSIKYNFLLLAHEYLPIFEKPIQPIRAKETGKLYESITQTLIRPKLKRKLRELETTTVWVFPEEDFEKRLNKNVIDRYSYGSQNAIVISLSQIKKGKDLEKKGKKKKLLFIKSPFSDNNSANLNIEFYLKEIKKIIEQELPNISTNGFLAIQTQDVRKQGYTESLAKKIIDSITSDNLHLKEIVFITKEDHKDKIQNQNKQLKITHQYLLVYKVGK
jgi:DNA modification methylase